MLVPGTKYNMTEESKGDYRYITTLHINSLNAQDYFEYQCVAKVQLRSTVQIIYGTLSCVSV